jgi:hypothetical protein
LNRNSGINGKLLKRVRFSNQVAYPDVPKALLSRNSTMIVAMILAGTVQMTCNYVIDVVTMRNSGVTTIFGMLVLRIVSRTFVIWCAVCGIRITHFKSMFVYMLAMLMMQMIIMRIIDMIAMLNRRMTARCAMLVIVPTMRFAIHF